MADIVLGLVAILVGAALCLRGYVAMRIIIPIWGFLVGFMVGAGFVASVTDEGLLTTLLGWSAGAFTGVLFGLLAYVYYEISVLIAMSAIGFTLGTTAMVALGVSWSWLTIVVGVVAGAALALFAILADVPMILLTLLTAAAGATVIVAGAMLLVGTTSLADFTTADTTATISDSWWWYVGYVALTVAGVIAQLTARARWAASLRSSWKSQGGRQLRAV